MEEYRKYEPVFGSWKIERLIGKGSFGNVFEISREEYGVTYRAALKIITVPQDEDDVKARMSSGTEMEDISEYYEGILKEIVSENEIMSKLKGNSNIVSYEDHQIIPHDDGIGYDVLIRMELLTPLLDLMIKRPLSEKEVVKLGIDICKALELCHKKNIIHRDIKPQNIFVSENGDFKLGDFGIARTMEKTTGGMSKKGTYKYMAPEVFRGEDYDSTVDIYSLGIVVYSLLNGNRGPFLPAPPAKVTHNDEEEARMRRFRGEEIPAPRDAGTMLTYIIKKACAANPADRYQSAEQMRRDLESYLANYGKQPAAPAPGSASEETVADRAAASAAAAAGSDRARAGVQAPPQQMPQTPPQNGRVAEAPKKKSNTWIIVVAVLAVVIAAAVAAFFVFGPGRGGAGDTGDPGTDGGAITDDSGETGETGSDEEANVYDAYAEILRENESEIRAYNSQLGATDRNVAITDISGDGIPELLFFEGTDASYLKVFTYIDGSAVECSYDNSVLPDETYNIPDDGLFIDAYVASGTSYMIYTGKKPGEFYIAYSISDENTRCNSIRYDFEGYGIITADKIVSNVFGPNFEGDGEFDDYYLNGSKVDLDKGAAEFKADRDAFDRLVMNNGYQEYMKVFELTKDHKAEAMTFDDALDRCVSG